MAGIELPPTASEHPDQFLDQVNTAITDIIKEIGDYLERTGTFIAENASEIGRIIGGPVGGLGGHLVEDRLTDYARRISESFEALMDEIRAEIGGILGKPFKITQIAGSYRDAIRAIGAINGDIVDEDNFIEDVWTLTGHTAYENASRNQRGAISGLSEMLEEAASLLISQRSTILSLWNDQLFNLYHLKIAIATTVVDMVEIENVVVGGGKGIVSLILTTLDGVGDIVEDGVTAWNQMLEHEGSWDGIDAAFAGKGFPDRRWPAIDGRINGPWRAA